MSYVIAYAKSSQQLRQSNQLGGQYLPFDLLLPDSIMREYAQLWMSDMVIMLCLSMVV